MTSKTNLQLRVNKSNDRTIKSKISNNTDILNSLTIGRNKQRKFSILSDGLNSKECGTNDDQNPSDMPKKVARSAATLSNKSKCEICNHYADSNKDLMIHITSSHSNQTADDVKPDQTKETTITSQSKCDICNYYADTNNDLMLHISSRHSSFKSLDAVDIENIRYLEGITDLSCEKCDFKTTYETNLKRHVLGVHEKIRGQKNKHCPQCDYSTDRRPNLQLHIKRVHEKIKDIVCTLCPFKTSGNSHLRTHIKIKHQKIKDKTCKYCKYATTRNRYLHKHIKDYHPSMV